MPHRMGTISWCCPPSRVGLHTLVIVDHYSKLPSLNRSISLLSLSKKLKTRVTLPSSSSSLANPLQFSSSSTVGALNEELGAASSGLVGENDLLIVGPGVLGRLVAKKWRQVLFGQRNHLVIEGEAALSWNGEGCFLFTSSSAPYDCNNNGQCDEDSPVVPFGRSPRTDVLLKAEKVVLESSGCVLRLAGLYKEDRGAHVYWLKKGTAEVRPDHILNLIHYEDAASLSVAILKKKFRGRILLGCDNHPLSRQEVMDLVAKSGKFSKKFEGFTGTSDPLGKKLNNMKTREEVGWEPQYPSFTHFLGVSD
ncbi:uncharacterized protein LOC110647458 isoform X3 [Hevea brasiliensis]|uniref:uncharacterized protein LOC110647458 isoform X3 n=1 Tax=Hevea brasiliensis TaxID=3981 RepID=UPI0025DC5596|nr:uncharacterized protein LOC110647458 isoform X3 [Hevea brasiliensis]